MLKYIDYQVPVTKKSLEEVFDDLEDATKLAPMFSNGSEASDFFKETIGLEEISCAQDQTETELMISLLSNFFEKGFIEPQKVDLIVVIADDLKKGNRIDNLGHFLQFKFNISKADVVQVSGNHCANIEYAVELAENQIKSGAVSNVLILASNVNVKNDERIIGTYAVQGDAVGLVFLDDSEQNGMRLIGKHSYTNGALFEADLNSNNSFVLCRNYLICISETLNKFNLKPSDFEHVLVQNANYFLIKQCLNNLGFKDDQLFLDNINKYGHLDSLDFLVNLKSVSELQYQPTTKLLSFGTGWAGSNICLIMETC